MELPEQDELVIAIIKKILPYGAFCVLPEYDNMEAFLHISEVAPRWIKNIHEFISEGQQHVTKVYRIDKEKNQVDISLKRVNDGEKRQKLELIQTERKATKLLELAIAESKTGLKVDQVRPALEEKFGDLNSVFTNLSEGDESVLSEVDLPQVLKDKIIEVAKKRGAKKQIIKLTGALTLKCFGEDGIERIKTALKSPKENITFHYLGAPRYQVTLTAQSSYKEAERELNALIEKIKTFAQKNNCDFGFERA